VSCAHNCNTLDSRFQYAIPWSLIWFFFWVNSSVQQCGGDSPTYMLLIAAGSEPVELPFMPLNELDHEP
jgi:hypothetical protein